MDVDLDTGRLVVFVGGLTLWIVVEQIIRSRTPVSPLHWRILLHAGVALFNTVTVRLLVYVPMLLWVVHVEEQGWGISRWLGLTGWVEFVLSVIVLDLFDYFWHRANHRVPFLWRFHKAHHMDNDMDVFTALRFHPGELLLSAIAKASWVVIWGPSAIAWFLFEVMVSFCAQMHHANFDLPDSVERVVARVIVTPRFHAAHHLVDREYGDRNFSTIFSFWDPLFGSLAGQLPAAEIRTRDFGLPEDRAVTLSPLELLLEPVRNRNLNITLDEQKLSRKPDPKG